MFSSLNCAVWSAEQYDSCLAVQSGAPRSQIPLNWAVWRDEQSELDSLER